MQAQDGWQLACCATVQYMLANLLQLKGAALYSVEVRRCSLYCVRNFAITLSLLTSTLIDAQEGLARLAGRFGFVQSLRPWWAQAQGQSLADLAVAVLELTPLMTSNYKVMRAGMNIICTSVAAVISCGLAPREEYLLLMDQCLLIDSMDVPSSPAGQLGRDINAKYWEFCHSGVFLTPP